MAVTLSDEDQRRALELIDSMQERTEGMLVEVRSMIDALENEDEEESP